jgi:hypothetical protein
MAAVAVAADAAMAAAVAVAVGDAAMAAAVALLQVSGAALELSALLQVSGAALELSALLQVSVAGAAAVSGYTALDISVCIADAHFSDAASAAVVVVAEAVGAAELAGYGHPPGAGSTPAGPNLHLRAKKLASRRSKSHKQRWLRKRTDESYRQYSSASRQFWDFLNSSGSLASSPRSFAPRRWSTAAPLSLCLLDQLADLNTRAMA